MNYDNWLKTVPSEITHDGLWKMEVYRLAIFTSDLSCHDVTGLMQDQRALRLAGQLYSAVGSVSANISEGYSRQSRKDQARYYEYAWGSAQESRGGYYKGRHLLGEAVTSHRLSLTTLVIRHLLRIIPAERGPMLKEEVVRHLVRQNPDDRETASQEVLIVQKPLEAPRTT